MSTGELLEEYVLALLALQPGHHDPNPVERVYAAHGVVQSQPAEVLVPLVHLASTYLVRSLQDRARDTGRSADDLWAELVMTMRADADVFPLILRPEGEGE